VGHPGTNESGDLEFIGTVMDITERKRAEEALRNAEAELARVARLTTMGELAASIAHEIQPAASRCVANAGACLHWLKGEEPNLDEARQAISRIARDGTRAGDVIRGLRALAKQSGRTWQGSTSMTPSRRFWPSPAMSGSGTGSCCTPICFGDRPVLGDRVQLQQVMLNLIMNGIEA